MKSSTVLKKAKKLLTEIGWCRDWCAKNRHGRFVDYMSTEACRFCARGAIWRVLGANGREETAAVDHFIECAIGTPMIAQWNDRQKDKRPVLRAFDRAIEIAKKEGR